ncbi:MAG: putative toxin-antitoxin system toxin component, PIN family [Thermomicrobiales bacterium]
MISAVLDANVLVSGFPRQRGAPSELIDRWLDDEFQLIVSEHILDGVVRAWSNPWFRDRFARHEVERALAVLRTEATVVIPVPGIQGVAPDDEDDLVLATAVAGNVDYLITGDRRFRAIGQYEAIAIRSPREFVAILDQADPPME